MLIFIGLGNPEERYLQTKHNIGFWTIDMFAEKHNLEFKAGKGNFIFAKKANEYILVKPTTGMNKSGTIIHDLLNFYKADMKDLVVIFDDVDLPLGEIRLRLSGGDGCHNRMKSIIHSLNTDEITRLRMGIAADDYKRPSENYVLKPFNKKYQSSVDQVLEFTCDAMSSIIKEGAVFTSNRFNKQIIGEA